MGLRALTLPQAQHGVLPKAGITRKNPQFSYGRNSKFITCAKKEKEEEPKERKQSLFSSVTEALDFSQVRSVQDAELLEEAREKTKSGDKMTREQVNVLVAVVCDSA